MRTQQLRMSDPRLPLIVSRAAIEFDNAANGTQVDFAAAKKLAEFLRSAFDCTAGRPVEQRNMDMNAVDIVGLALEQPATAMIVDVVAKAALIVSKLENPTQDQEGASLTSLRDFCVAFGNGLISYRESLRDSLPVNPYRR